MAPPFNPLSLADWRQQVADLYAQVRSAPPGCEAEAHGRLCRGRERLFAIHPETPLERADRETFPGLDYYPYDSRWRVLGTVDAAVRPVDRALTLTGNGSIGFTQVAAVRFTGPAGDARLDLYWVEGYGGGLFLPFRDATSGRTTYRGGRYLIDTAKGANLGMRDGQLVLDFNYAYNPSCAYSDRWACPLAPQENALPFQVPVGERSRTARGMAGSDEGG